MSTNCLIFSLEKEVLPSAINWFNIFLISAACPVFDLKPIGFPLDCLPVSFLIPFTESLYSSAAFKAFSLLP